MEIFHHVVISFKTFSAPVAVCVTPTRQSVYCLVYCMYALVHSAFGLEFECLS